MSDTPPGWYDDGSGQQRWWNGTAWANVETTPRNGSRASATIRNAALAALIVGIVSFFFGLLPVVGLLAGGGAVTLGILALRKQQSRAMAITGIVLGGIAMMSSLGTTAAMLSGPSNFAAEQTVSPEESQESDPKPFSTPTPTGESVESEKSEETQPAEEKPEPTAKAQEPTKKAAPEKEPGLTDAEKSALLDEDLKFALFVESSYQELLAVDPTLWGGYLVGVRVEGSDAYFTLQVNRESPEGKEMGERAAQALSTLLTQETVDELELSWVIVEDGAGVVIAQKRSSPLF